LGLPIRLLDAAAIISMEDAKFTATLDSTSSKLTK
jgi:hypothetical protein